MFLTELCLFIVWHQWRLEGASKVKLICLSSMFMLFLLRPPTNPGYHDITMHALYFLLRGRGKTRRRECPTYDEERVEEKGKMDHWP